MAKVTVFLSCILVSIFAQNVSGENEPVTIQLHGKFLQQHEYYTSEVSTLAKAELSSARERFKRGASLMPPLTFSGALIIKLPGDNTYVVGVNSTFAVEEVNVPAEKFDSNRVKRDAKRKTQIVLYGQFAFGHPEPDTDVLGVRLTLEFSQKTSKIIPMDSSKVHEILDLPELDLRFNGTMSAKNDENEVFFKFASHLGLREKIIPNFDYDYDDLAAKSRVNRVKRKAEKTVLELDGDWTFDETRRNGDRVIEVTGVKGHVTLEPMNSESGKSPRQVFENEDRSSGSVLIETSGNVTYTLNDAPVLGFPVDTSFTASGKSSDRSERSVEDDKVVGVEYNGVVSAYVDKKREPESFGLSAGFKFWLISKTPARK